MKRVLSLTAAAVLALALATAGASAASAHPASPKPVPSPMSAAQGRKLAVQLRNGTLANSVGVLQICKAHHLACQAQVLTKKRAGGDGANARPMAFNPDLGYSAKQLETAYGVSKAPAGHGTIVVIGAGAYPTLASDLAIYRSTYGLPACTTASGCFKQMNYLGGAPYQPATNLNDQFGEEEIAVETALDVDMASAACPGCKIISMQVPLHDGFFGNKAHIDGAIHHFALGVQTARKLGASAVSISYGYPTDTYSDTGAIAKLMTQRGMPIVSSSGDDGALGRVGQWPQSLPTVTSAGGTSLYPDSGSSRHYSEVAWNFAGSDCTPGLGPAEGQPKSVSNQCDGHRAASDISSDADPFTGPSIYDSYAPGSGEPLGFLVVGGTSVSSPFLAGLYARAGHNANVLGPNTIYADAASAFHDVTIGTNYGIDQCYLLDVGNSLCDAGRGWDGPTGRGTPNGLAPFGG